MPPAVGGLWIAVVGPVRLWWNLCVPTESGRNLCASGATCPPLADRLTNNYIEHLRRDRVTIRTTVISTRY